MPLCCYKYWGIYVDESVGRRRGLWRRDVASMVGLEQEITSISTLTSTSTSILRVFRFGLPR